MLPRIIVPVIRNPIYIIAALTFVIVHRFMPELLYTSTGIGGISFVVLRTALNLLVLSFFMAGIGNLLKNIIVKGSSGPVDFMEGVNLYFSRVLGINLLITLLTLLGGPVVVIFRPVMLMGGAPPLLALNYSIAVFF